MPSMSLGAQSLPSDELTQFGCCCRERLRGLVELERPLVAQLVVYYGDGGIAKHTDVSVSMSATH